MSFFFLKPNLKIDGSHQESLQKYNLWKRLQALLPEQMTQETRTTELKRELPIKEDSWCVYPLRDILSCHAPWATNVKRLAPRGSHSNVASGWFSQLETLTRDQRARGNIYPYAHSLASARDCLARGWSPGNHSSLTCIVPSLPQAH